MYKFFVFVILSLNSNLSYAAMYKCTDAEGKVQFRDSPCETGLDAQSFTKRGAPKSEYSVALQRLTERQITARELPKTEYMRKSVEPKAKRSALKIYTRTLLLDDMAQYCSPVLEQYDIDLDATLKKFKDIHKDNILVGSRVFDEGLKSRWGYVWHTHEESVAEVEKGKSNNTLTYVEADGVSRKDVEIACKVQHEMVEGETQTEL